MAKKLYYKIGEACKRLDIQPYVLRYWETEFPALAPEKSKSGQRVYSVDDLEIIRRIKDLLYEEGYTIAGAKKKLDTEMSAAQLSLDNAMNAEPAKAVEAEEKAPAPASPKLKLAPSPPKPKKAKAEADPASDEKVDERVSALRQKAEELLVEAEAILELLEPTG